MPTVLPELSLNSTGAYAMSEPTLMTPLSWIVLGQLVGERGRAGVGGAGAVASLVLGLVTAAGEQQGAGDRDRTDRGYPGPARRSYDGWCLRSWSGSSGGWGSCRWRAIDGHTPSSVATSCDYGILPFGLEPFGRPPCQNRITGDPRTGTRAGHGGHRRAGIIVCRRSPAFRPEDLRRLARGPCRARHSRHRSCELAVRYLSRIYGYESCHRDVTSHHGLVRGARPSGKKVLTPLIRGSGRVCGAPVAYVPPLPSGPTAEQGTYAVPAHPSSTRSGHPQPMKT